MVKASTVKIFFVLISILFSTNLFAQNKSLLRADFLSPGISYEHRTFKNATIYANASLAPRFAFINNEKYLGLHPLITLRHNQYLNLQKREQRGANIDGNSGNYLSVGISWEVNAGLDLIKTQGFKTNKGASQIGFPFGFGMQRMFSKKLYYNAFLGGSYSLFYDQIQPMISLKIGYTILKK